MADLDELLENAKSADPSTRIELRGPKGEPTTSGNTFAASDMPSTGTARVYRRRQSACWDAIATGTQTIMVDGLEYAVP
jgi:hypothetical protein